MFMQLTRDLLIAIAKFLFHLQKTSTGFLVRVFGTGFWCVSGPKKEPCGTPPDGFWCILDWKECFL